MTRNEAQGKYVLLDQSLFNSPGLSQREVPVDAKGSTANATTRDFIEEVVAALDVPVTAIAILDNLEVAKAVLEAEPDLQVLIPQTNLDREIAEFVNYRDIDPEDCVVILSDPSVEVDCIPSVYALDGLTEEVYTKAMEYLLGYRKFLEDM